MPWAGGGAAGALAAAEVGAPLLLLCWLCCWPDAEHDDSGEGDERGRHPDKPALHPECTRRRSSELAGRRRLGSAVSLHLPGTSGHAAPPAHRSHEELPARRRSQPPVPVPGDSARYHSAPSVISEVLRRRDWQRSARDLDTPATPCPRDGKESTRLDDKDTDDVTEMTFYDEGCSNERGRDVCGAGGRDKRDKQTINESIRSGVTSPPLPDRSGAERHPRDSRLTPPTPGELHPLPTLEAARCECSLSALLAGGAGGAAGPDARHRHASDGDILAAAHRPQSGAFSESDLDLELDACDEPPPYDTLIEYSLTPTTVSHSHTPAHYHTPTHSEHKETAI